MLNSLSWCLLIPVVHDELSVNENPRLSIAGHSELVVSVSIRSVQSRELSEVERARNSGKRVVGQEAVG